MAFMTRFDTMPSLDVLAETPAGVVVIDGLVAGVPVGVSSGVACCVGEFADVTYGVSISALGVVATSPEPVEIIGGDFEEKVGGFDLTIGEHGGDQGNGFLECKGRKFSRLVCSPVNIAATQGARLWRELPTNVSATDPSPVTEVVAATVVAGTEFRTAGGNRVRSAKRVTFTAPAEYTRAIDGSVTNAGGVAAFQAFVSATGAFTTLVRADGKVGVKVGDILVLGVIGGALGLGGNADTYRVRLVTNATTLSVEKMDGSTFDWTTTANMPWRLYTGAAADTGGEFAVASQGGYRIPARPLDATVPVDTQLSPTVAADPVDPTATTTAPLSGLQMRSAPVTGIVYVAAVHAPNVANSATVDALYVSAINAVLVDADPTADVSIIWAARKSATIRDTLAAFTQTRKAEGRGCVAVWSPPLDTVSKTTVLADATPGVGAKRLREGIYAWPGLETYVVETVGQVITRADGLTTVDGTLDTTADGWLCSIMSCLAPERNPGEATAVVQSLLAGWIQVQRGVTGLDRGFYKRALQKGIAAPRISRGANGQTQRQFQEGITTSLESGKKEINVRRFSFYVQDTAVALVEPFSKQLMTPQVKDDVVTALTDFFEVLLSGNGGPPRIVAYKIDAVSGNTPTMMAAGILVVKIYVQMISDARIIVLDTRVGLNVAEAFTSLQLAA